MKKKVKPPQIFSAEPKSVPESVLLKLTKRFELLKEAIATGKKQVDDYRNAQNAASINYDISIKYNGRKLAEQQRELRMLNQDLQNVREQLDQELGRNNKLDCGQGCESIHNNRLR